MNMQMSRDEAVQHLRDIETTQGRSAKAYGYTAAAPFLILWGAIWAVGYTATELWPMTAGQVWSVLGLGGGVASAVLGVRRGRSQPWASWRIFAAWLSGGAFFVALFAVLQPVSSNQIGAIVPLFVALAYVLLGLWMGTRFVVAGIVIGALTTGGFFYLPAHFALWMAVVGGGALILAGLWMRRI